MRYLASPLVRLLSAVGALALIALGVVLAVDAVAALAGVGPVILPEDWVDRLRDLAWTDSDLARGLWIGFAAGIVCLVVALWRRPPATIDTTVEGFRVERRSFERALARQLEQVDGVSSARVRAGRRRVRARLDTARRLDPSSVERTAQEATIDLERRLGVRVGAHDFTTRRVHR